MHIYDSRSSTDCDDEPQYYYDSKADSSFDSKRENKNRRERERIKSKRKLLTDLDKLIKSSDLLPPEKKAKRFTEVLRNIVTVIRNNHVVSCGHAPHPSLVSHS